jgi:hypothetical protein
LSRWCASAGNKGLVPDAQFTCSLVPQKTPGKALGRILVTQPKTLHTPNYPFDPSLAESSSFKYADNRLLRATHPGFQPLASLGNLMFARKEKISPGRT